MITVSTNQLFKAVSEADVFRLPEMSTGTEYLYNNIYGRLSRCEEVKLSSLNFDAFELEDIDSISGLYTNIFERNDYTANSIISTLRKTSPVHKAVAYV